MLQQDLATSHTLAATFVLNGSTAYQRSARQIMRSLVEARNGRTRVQLTVVDAATQANVHVLEQEGPSDKGVIPILDSLARKLDPANASQFSTRNQQALVLFASAFTTPDAATRNQLLSSAVAADPGFGLAQIARLENDSSAYPSTATVPSSSFSPLDRARWNVLTARLNHAPPKSLSDAEAAVVALAPNNVEALSALGVHRFLLGNVHEGDSLLRKAISLNPWDLNLKIELAGGFVSSRRFTEAAGVLAPLAANNPNLLPPLALVQLLAGQNSSADASFRRMISFLPAGSPLAPALEAQWQRFVSQKVELSPTDTVDYWKDQVSRLGEGNMQAKAMLAAALENAGDHNGARSLGVLPFVPDFTDPNAPPAFNEMRRLQQPAK